MNPVVIFYNFIIRIVSPLLVLIAKRWKNTFYLYLAALFSVLIVLDAAWLRITVEMQHGAYDVMMRYRAIVPKPDPDIVIVDINEASLAAMSGEFGRWPWPRQVLGEFLEHLEAQRPRAVVFDILFSDPDVYNPDSDAYFDAVVANTTNTYFPFLRLHEASDALSKVKPAMIPGVAPIAGAAQDNATIAVVLPHFPSILKGGRLGLHNIYPDSDGIAREYPVYRDDYGWRIPSLPARVIRDLGLPEPESERVLLNWRGKPFTYPVVGFSEVFNDMASKQRSRPQDEFTNKIVLIGSTAPSLFDVKATPLSSLHPGVEILATAIDNMKRNDYLRFPEGRLVYPLVGLLIIWVIGIAIYRDPEGGRIDRVVGMFEFILLTVGYASINLTNTFINLTGPITFVLAYYALARIYGIATDKVLETGVLQDSMEREGELGAFLLLVRAAEDDPLLGQRKLQRLRRKLVKSGAEPKSIEMLSGRQKGIWSLFNRTLAVSWVFPAHDEAARARVALDVEALTATLNAESSGQGDASERAATWLVHEGRLAGGKAARAGWAALFAEAQWRWHRDAAQHRSDRS